MNLEQRNAINRANAAKSTGPKTPEGKQRSSLNATRHGLTGQVVVLTADDLTAYTKHILSFQDDLEPTGAVEQQLTQIVADGTWRMHRGSAYESNCATLAAQAARLQINTEHTQVGDALAAAQAAAENAKAIANMSLYQQRTARIVERTLKQLRELQAERRERERLEMAEAVVMLRHHKRENPRIPYNPQRDGFVFSSNQIETQSGRARRRAEAVMQARAS